MDERHLSSTSKITSLMHLYCLTCYLPLWAADNHELTPAKDPDLHVNRGFTCPGACPGTWYQERTPFGGSHWAAFPAGPLASATSPDFPECTRHTT